LKPSPWAKSPEWRRKLSEALRGKKRGPLSAETRQKMSESRRGKKHSAEWCRKIAEANRGKKASAEARQHMSEAGRRRAPPNAGTRRKLVMAGKGRKHSQESRAKMSEAAKHRTPEHRRKLSECQKGKPHRPELMLALWRASVAATTGKHLSPEHRAKIAEAQKGPKSRNWKGGGYIKGERETSEYRIWHRAVLKRDGFRCRQCDIRNVRLHVHHIIPWAIAPSKRYEVENGVTLCIPCHRKTHKYEQEIVA